MELSHAYAFAGGAFVGRFTGILPSAIISGFMFYIADNTLFSIDNITQVKNIIIQLFSK